MKSGISVCSRSAKFHRLHGVAVTRAPGADIARDLPQADCDPILRIQLADFVAECVRQRQTVIDGVFEIGRVKHDDFALFFARPDQCRRLLRGDDRVCRGLQPPQRWIAIAAPG